MSGDRPGGCIALIGFAVLELAAGIATGAIAYLAFAAILVPLIPATERDFAKVLSGFFALIAAVVPLWYIDRWCARVTGHSILDNIPFVP